MDTPCFVRSCGLRQVSVRSQVYALSREIKMMRLKPELSKQPLSRRPALAGDEKDGVHGKVDSIRDQLPESGCTCHVWRIL